MVPALVPLLQVKAGHFRNEEHGDHSANCCSHSRVVELGAVTDPAQDDVGRQSSKLQEDPQSIHAEGSLSMHNVDRFRKGHMKTRAHVCAEGLSMRGEINPCRHILCICRDAQAVHI